VRQLADGLHQLSGFPPNIMNVYLADGVLIDSATRHAKRRIFRQLEGRDLTAHALTHVHPDHQGCSKVVCDTFGIPLWCPENDADAMEDGKIASRQPGHPMNRVSERVFAGPPRKVDRRLREGDEVAGFTVLDTPGHSRGHVAYWREADRTLILGDVLFGLHPTTGVPGLHWPPDRFTPDPARNRESARRLADLHPALICFGHGPPSRDTRKFQDFVRASK
jgi:hydroxyacylglutathione hydrolase